MAKDNESRDETIHHRGRRAFYYNVPVSTAFLRRLRRGLDSDSFPFVRRLVVVSDHSFIPCQL